LAWAGGAAVRADDPAWATYCRPRPIQKDRYNRWRHAEYAEMGVATYNISVAKVAQIMMERFLDDCRQRGGCVQ
jgi:hypothetical protein